jgi:uncharacterized membrane protein
LVKTRTFFNQLDNDRMVAAIAAAERTTSGEIRVYVSRRDVANAQQSAVRAFERLGMHKTKLRNAVLIYVAPKSQRFAIIGDEAVHAKCGQPFWDAVAAGMSERFRSGDMTGAIVHGIENAGKRLARHFPRSRDDIDELPDTIAGNL